MPWCPKCRAEYRDGFETCADCGEALVAQRPEITSPLPQVPVASPKLIPAVLTQLACMVVTVIGCVPVMFMGYGTPRSAWFVCAGIDLLTVFGLIFASGAIARDRLSPAGVWTGWLLVSAALWLPGLADMRAHGVTVVIRATYACCSVAVCGALTTLCGREFRTDRHWRHIALPIASAALAWLIGFAIWQ